MVLMENSGGDYHFSSVAPGTYTITARARSFTQQTLVGLSIDLGVHIEENFQLEPGDDQQMVSINGMAPLIHYSDVSVGGVITAEQMSTLPVPNRQYLDLALLLPGTSQDATRSFYNNVQSGGGGYYYANGSMLENLLESSVISNAQSAGFGKITNVSNAQEGELAAQLRF